VFHCSHGIHRTGTGAAIVLSLLGVDWDIVRRDYLRSNELRAGEVHRRLEQMVEAVAATRDVSPGEIDMANMEAFMVQDASYIDASRDQIMGEFGSFDRYAREGLGVDATVVQSLRDELLD
jgi:protein-tyrosine phosphatase